MEEDGKIEKFPYSQLSDDPDIESFERRIRENLYELNNKRGLLAALGLKLQEITMEKQNLEIVLDKTKRELEEAKIQLEIAFKVARKWESEKTNGTESLVRQTVQLDVTVKERDMLLEQIRLLQMDNAKLKQQLDQLEHKERNYASYQESFQMKQSQCHAALVALAKQLSNLEQDHSKLKRMSSGAIEISRKAIYRLSQQRNILQETLRERNILRDQLLSLTAELEKIKSERIKKEVNDDTGHQCRYLQEWTSAQEDMAARNKEKDEAYQQLQNVLDSNIMSLNGSVIIQKKLEEKIMILENNLKSAHGPKQTVTEAVQTDITEHISPTYNKNDLKNEEI